MELVRLLPELSGYCGLRGPAPHPIPTTMLRYTLIFLVVAIIAAVLGFGGIAGTAAWIAKVCFFVFLIFAIVSFFKK